MIYVRFLIFTKVFIYSGCETSMSLTDITSITTSLNKLIGNLGKMLTLIWIFCWQSTPKFLNLILRILQNRLISWPIFFCISLECSPINHSLRYLILISVSKFSELFSFLQYILPFKYDLTIWVSFSQKKFGKSVWTSGNVLRYWTPTLKKYRSTTFPLYSSLNLY